MKSRTLVVGLGCALLLALLALPALSQGIPTGKLTGHVTSQGDQSLPGVTVTVSSPNLQGNRNTVTSGNGDYLFPALPPGAYTVTFELQGLDTQKKAVEISAAQSITVDVEMALSHVQEEILVTGNLETISAGTQSATTYTKKLVDELPVGRTVSDVVNLAPGVHATGPGKDSSTRLGSITVSGAISADNLFLINGVVVNENLRGQPLDLFIEDAIQETTTASAGVSAEFGRFSGGVINILTKSGGNQFTGSFRSTLNNQSWEQKTPLTVQRTDKTIPTYEATLGGPVSRDRLWFFLAGRAFDQTQTLNTASFPNLPSIAYQNSRNQKRYEGKLTASITPQHSLIGSYIKVDDALQGSSFGNILDTASLYNPSQPQDLRALNYSGVLTSNFFLSAQYSLRKFTFENSGAPSTDIITGTLLLDRSRGNARYHSPTFCGICGPENRDNKNGLLKGSYFLSTGSLGTHELVAGYDTYKDIRKSNNHQSGSDFRVFGDSVILSGGNLFPVFVPFDPKTQTVHTIIQFNPIFKSSLGTDFVTNSVFANDSWRLNERLSFNLGLRYDGNDGKDAEGKKVAKDSNISPRLAVTIDPWAKGDWLFNVSYGKYVAAIANAVADSTSVAGSPANFQWAYGGPAINTGNPANPVDANAALRQLFDWFNSVGGTKNTALLIASSIPGGNTIIRGSLNSPNVQEYTVGATKRLGSRGLIRADYIHRKFADFYSQRTDQSTGQVTTASGPSDLTLIQNNNSALRRAYDGLDTQFRFRLSDRLDFGGNWTLSHTKGNFDGETRNSGPVPGDVLTYPEYKEARWNSPDGDLQTDQRHKASLYGIYNIFSNDRNALNISLLQSFFSGHPYEAIGLISDRSFVHNPGYLTPPGTVSYFFTGRGHFTTDNVLRTDLSANYDFKISGVDLFLQPEIINVFNTQKIDTTDSRYFDTSVFTASNSGASSCSQAGAGGGPGKCLPFNPFTTTPVEHVNWEKGPRFGQAINPLGFQQPRTYRFSVGIRF
ncbi:MAG TPA: carboxypeptidase regulatory-like domain-containing protein [Thermoanaerobaculia bacterium]|nr:carboxypeptidase regulatory-like domain-containing protein [Thermoanaerobaculia bacterium]